MAEELQMKDLQMKGLTEKLTELLSGLDKSKRKELDLNDIQSKLKEFQIALDAGHIEFRHLGPNATNKNEYKIMLRDHKSSLKELKNEFEWKKAAATKDELLADGSNGADNTELETAEGMMKHGLDIQDKSKQSLERTLRVVQDTKTIGQDTNAKLEANTAQIEGMHDKLESIESTLQRSTKVIKRMARKMATDKYVWVIVFLVFVAIVFLIVWKNIKKSSTTDLLVPSTSAIGLYKPPDQEEQILLDYTSNTMKLMKDKWFKQQEQQFAPHNYH